MTDSDQEKNQERNLEETLFSNRKEKGEEQSEISPAELLDTMVSEGPELDDTIEIISQENENFTISRESFWSHKSVESFNTDSKKPEKRYLINDFIGKGGGSQVFEGEDTHLDRMVAIKIQSVHPEDKNQKRVSANFIKEAITTASLDHPNIVPVYDLDLTSDNRLFLAIKKVEGQSMGDLVGEAKEGGGRSDKISRAKDIASIFIKLCDALTYAHSKGIIHQDIKPANVMLGEYGEVFLIDWGTASGSDHKKEIRGTPAFMSLEQAKMEPVDERSDVYSLGASLYNVLTLHFPIWGKSMEEFWTKKISGNLDPLPHGAMKGVSPHLMAIAKKALGKNPEDRYQSIREMGKDLLSFQNGRSVSVYRDSIIDRVYKVYRRNLLLCNSIGSLTLLLLGVISFSVYRDLQAKQLQLSVELSNYKLEEERKDQWLPVASHDFRYGKPLSEGFSVGGLYEPAGGVLRLGFESLVDILEWKGRVGSDVKIKLNFRCEQKPRFHMTLSDDHGSFSRHIYLHRYFNLKKDADAYSSNEDMYADFMPIHQHIHSDGLNEFMLWKRGNVWFAELNGVLMMEYYDQYPNSNSESLSIVIRQYQPFANVQIERLEISKRQPATYVPFLEEGKALMRMGMNRSAKRWFLEKAELVPNHPLTREAEFLAATIDVGQGVKRQLEELDKIVQKKDHPFRSAAIYRSIPLLIDTEEWELAMRRSVELFNAERKSYSAIKLTAYLSEIYKSLNQKEKKEFFEKMPLSNMELKGFDLTEIPLKMNENITDLTLSGNPVSDIFSLRDKKLYDLSLDSTQVSDISAISSMPLSRLNISRAPVISLAPLKGKWLSLFYARYCEKIKWSTIPNCKISNVIFDGSKITDPQNLERIDADTVRVSRCGLTNLNFIKGMSPYSLKAFSNDIDDISGLEGMNLKDVLLGKNLIEDLSPLKSAGIYGTLLLTENPVEDLTPLQDQPIRTLKIVGTAVRDFSILSSLPKLRNLQMGSGRFRTADRGMVESHLRGISTLKGLKLKWLDLSGSHISDIASLKNNVLFGELNISNNPVSDISPLTGQMLTSLDISQCAITDFSIIKSLRNLRHLKMKGVRYQNREAESRYYDDISSMSDLQLENLDLSINEISDISSLQSCVISQSLNLAENPIEDLTPLRGSLLRHLNITSTKVNNLDVLLTMPNLSMVYISGVKLTAQHWAVMKELSHVRFHKD